MARLATVYDFSSLRLHPDGSRVRQSASKNKKLRYAAGAVRDSRGNWFARDAAGSGTVGQYRKVQEKEEHEEEWNDVDEGEEDELFQRKGKGKEKETTGRWHDPRPAKRQKFLQDFDFLTPTASGSSPTDALPSSDLLKSIHYFASSYYHERGQLFNATKEYRQMRKQNRLKRLEKQKKVEAEREDSGELGQDSEQDEANRPRRGGRQKGVTGKTVYRKDMYKLLDGSALMAIGMLIQEYVSRTLEVRIPDGWEDMMRDAYIDEEPTTYSHKDSGSIVDEGNLGDKVTDTNSEDIAEKDGDSEEDGSGEDDDDDESREVEESEVQQDNSDDDDEEGEEEEVGD